jgi:hypothetical protein
MDHLVEMMTAIADQLASKRRRAEAVGALEEGLMTAVRAVQDESVRPGTTLTWSERSDQLAELRDRYQGAIAAVPDAIEHGGFITAMVNQNYREAFVQADPINRMYFGTLVYFREIALPNSHPANS